MGHGSNMTDGIVRFEFEGRAIECKEGMTLAAALAAAGESRLRHSADGTSRGIFCGMGVCFDCLVSVDGRPGQRACLTKVRDGMRIAPQPHRGPAPAPDAPPLAEPPAGPIPERVPPAPESEKERSVPRCQPTSQPRDSAL